MPRAELKLPKVSVENALADESLSKLDPTGPAALLFGAISGLTGSFRHQDYTVTITVVGR
jgi:hypothetical protein